MYGEEKCNEDPIELVWKLLTLVSVSEEIKIYDGGGLNPLMEGG